MWIRWWWAAVICQLKAEEQQLKMSLIANQSVHFPMTSDIKKAFRSTQRRLTWYFLFFFLGPFSVILEANNPLSSPIWYSVWTPASHHQVEMPKCKLLPCDRLICHLNWTGVANKLAHECILFLLACCRIPLPPLVAKNIWMWLYHPADQTEHPNMQNMTHVSQFFFASSV